jgi:hypothetical protein
MADRSETGGQGGGNDLVDGQAGDGGASTSAEAGTAGAGDGGAPTSAGGESAGDGGASTSAGGESAGAGDGGSAGTPGTGHLSISESALDFTFVCPGPSTIAAQTVTLTNDGDAPVSWTSSFDAALVSVAPTGSTLAAGAHVDVAISPLAPPLTLYDALLVGQVHFQSDVPGATPLDVDVTEYSGGYYAPPRADLDFGDVYVGTSPSLAISVDPDVLGEVLSSDNESFQLSGVVPNENAKWVLTFNPFPVVLGTQTATLTRGSMFDCVLSPNTITVTANLVYDTSCTHVGEGAPCSDTETCVSGVCGGL